ncbi:MAG: hypothetical protein CSA72_03160 [Rhodobacterales bacterium]|nr:MAG: hypothetical protein CSA72_03160 [Rhodobacterales bacterium]
MDPMDIIHQYRPQTRERAIALRGMIHACAAQLGADVAESVKWGQPSFAVPKGTPIRLGQTEAGLAIYTHCQTRVMSDLAARFANLPIEGNRALHLADAEPLPMEPVAWLIRRALTYKNGST